ncbi:hypothetical protein ACIRPE_08785 [Kitasatospora aureofaciens]|uniref:hypothetical protein n=1 Tax=Kitasatospora aureofaciens TaxID=1894 RepID=UPI000AF404AC|nr:hypothetical protein [Kitasatospora aureofaciens]
MDLDRIARATPGFSGADLANLVNEAAINAVRAERSTLTAGDLDTARDGGASRTARVLQRPAPGGTPLSRRARQRRRHRRPLLAALERLLRTPEEL